MKTFRVHYKTWSVMRVQAQDEAHAEAMVAEIAKDNILNGNLLEVTCVEEEIDDARPASRPQ